jgi:hypothetical protein
MGFQVAEPLDLIVIDPNEGEVFHHTARAAGLEKLPRIVVETQ